jgi:hypothetical protein
MANDTTGRLLYPAEAAPLLFTSVKNLARLAADGRLQARSVRVLETLGGHRRYVEADVLALRERLINGEEVGA